MPKAKWQTATPCRYRDEEAFVINRRTHDALHESSMKFEGWMFLQYCRMWPSRVVEPSPNEWIGVSLLYRDREIDTEQFANLYYATTSTN